MVYPQTLVQATTLSHLSQQMQAATTPEDLLRVFIEPVWRKGNCSAVLAYLDRRLEDVDDWTAEILASIAASEPTISLSPIGARYRASAVPMLRTLFSDREMIRV
jgi:hypothetical protein